MAEAEQKERRVQVRLPGSMPLPDPEGANYFHLTAVGGEIQLLVGAVNLIHLHEARSKAGDVVVVPDISHRFILSRMGYEQLRQAVETISAVVSTTEPVAVEVQRSR